MARRSVRSAKVSNRYYKSLKRRYTHGVNALEGLGIVALDEVFDDDDLDLAWVVLECGKGFDLVGLVLGSDGTTDGPTVLEVDDSGVNSDEAVEASDQDGGHVDEIGVWWGL